ncbi:hypothetical protein [Nocardia seriolae]|uniref:hypothetical protein n=1 Tax=Nocardia seriolae TaxID=37332 RepID=UPI00090AC125|nr:hypothetical protein [Nocardia seriolae]WKY52718.1 hypothetical protein Q5P07_00535 [Nocardia seriolae]BAW03375.1 membrane protein [Nocardia seriolae]
MTIGTLAITLAWVPFGDSEQAAMLAAVAVIILGYSGFRLAVGLGYLPAGVPAGGGVREVAVRRVRQQDRLVSRSWLEFTVGGKERWLPVYFDLPLVAVTQGTAELSGRAVYVDGGRVYPAGRVRDSEPVGKLIDNPARPDPEALGRSGIGRRLLLDAQSAVVAPFAALLWVYVAGGGWTAFVAATLVAAATATWLPAIRGSDPT